MRLPAVGVVGGIWFLSSQSMLPHPKGILGFDKLQHCLAYGVLAFTLGLWFRADRPAQEGGRPRRREAALTVLLASLYGVIDEIHQYFVPGRDCSPWDWAADAIGAVLGTMLLALCFRFFGKLRPSSQRRAGAAAAGINPTARPSQ